MGRSSCLSLVISVTWIYLLVNLAEPSTLPDQPGISENSNATEIDVRAPMYITFYERGCPCLDCGGMFARECGNLCDFYGYRYFDCNRCSCQCGRGFGGGGGGGSNAVLLVAG